MLVSAMKKSRTTNLSATLTRSIKGENRRQRAWQLTSDGESLAKERESRLASARVSIRDQEGTMLTMRADRGCLSY